MLGLPTLPTPKLFFSVTPGWTHLVALFCNKYIFVNNDIQVMLMQFLKTQFVLKFYYLQITCTTFSEELILLFYSEYTDKNTHSVERYRTLK